MASWELSSAGELLKGLEQRTEPPSSVQGVAVKVTRLSEETSVVTHCSKSVHILQGSSLVLGGSESFSKHRSWIFLVLIR